MSCALRSPSRLLAPILLLVLASSPAAFAEQATIESPASLNILLSTMQSSPVSFARVAPPRLAAVPPLEPGPVDGNRAQRPRSLPPLYAAFAVLQALDAHSTLSAVRAGLTEANPALRSVVTQPATFIAAKLAASAGTVYLTERLWRRHRMAAVMLMVAVNGTYGVIVANNYRSRASAR
jgi:hypothetical protein